MLARGPEVLTRGTRLEGTPRASRLRGIFTTPLPKRYYASRISCAYFFFVLVGLVALTVPFFLAYTNVPSFWLKIL